MTSKSADGQGTDQASESVLAEIKQRATKGAVMVGVRGVIIRLFSAMGGVLLARMLQPRDFGVVAFGTAFYSFIAFASDAGLGAGLIRRETIPSRAELGSVVTIQLTVATVVTGLTIALAWPHGLVGQVTSLMVVALPLAAFRTPSTIMFERELRYGPLVIVETVQMFVYYLWAVAAVVMGWGVWGLASGTLVQTVVGTLLMVLVSPVGVVPPYLSWKQLRSLIGFGAKFQAISIVMLIRDQGLNVGTGAIAGTSTLGLWSLANSVLRAPYLLFESLWRVSYPMMAKYERAGGASSSAIEKMVALTALGAGLLLVPLVGAGPHWVGLVFGPQWSESARVFPWASLGLMIAGPISVASAGYLYAIGDATKVLQGVAAHMFTWIVVAFLLLPSRGVEALGLGWLAASAVEAIVLGYGSASHSGANLARPLGVQLCASVVAAVIGWVCSLTVTNSLAAPILGALLAEAVFVGFMLAFKPGLIRSTAALVRLVVVPNRIATPL